MLEAGKSTPDFTVNAGAKSTCLSTQLLPPYAAQTGCPVSISFAPLAAGNVSATLVMLGANNALLASIPLDGSGTGAAVQALPAAQSTIGASGSLVSPSQIAVDAAGNLYVADSGLKAVEMYPSGSGSSTAGTSVGTGLKAPTGVAVDGAGDVFIADSGSVYEVPESQTGAGLNAKGQLTLQTGLGSQVQLAADGLGDLYVADISKQKVYELENFSTGLNASLPGVLATQTVTLSGAAVSAPSAIAVDAYNDLFVADGGSAYEITPTGTQTQVLSGLSGINGVAVDPSGSVLVTATGGAVRIPYVSGALNPANETTVAAGVTSPTAVTLDSLGNIYVADGSALDVNFNSASAGLNFGTLTAEPPAAGSSSTQTATLLNYGNAPLKVTGYDSVLSYFLPTDAAAGYSETDFTETADTCSGNTIAIDSTCTATITFSPAPGDGGNLADQVLVEGNVSNAPVGVNATGVAPTLASVTVTSPTSTTGTIENVPVSVTVTPTVSGSPDARGNRHPDGGLRQECASSPTRPCQPSTSSRCRSKMAWRRSIRRLRQHKGCPSAGCPSQTTHSRPATMETPRIPTRIRALQLPFRSPPRYRPWSTSPRSLPPRSTRLPRSRLSLVLPRNWSLIRSPARRALRATAPPATTGASLQATRRVTLLLRPMVASAASALGGVTAPSRYGLTTIL